MNNINNKNNMKSIMYTTDGIIETDWNDNVVPMNGREKGIEIENKCIRDKLEEIK